jgi:nucleotide-binding universal stress UspA family protein
MSTISGTPHEASSLHLRTSPIHIKGILAATDLSGNATRALRIAAHLAKQLHSRLHVLHAVTPQVYVPGGGALSPVLQEVDIEHAQAKLQKYIAGVPEVRTLKHEELVVCDEPTEALAALVETKGIDLVVMGSHGRGGLSKMVLGSHAEAAIRQLHCPVLVVGPKCHASHGALKSVVLATGLPVGILRAAQYAMTITKAFGATATIVHVLPHTDRHPDEFEVEKSEAIMQIMQLVPADPDLAKHIHYEVAVGNRAEQILKLAQACNAGVIVMGVREHKILADHAPWATLSEVIRNAHCPVLAVRPHLI